MRFETAVSIALTLFALGLTHAADDPFAADQPLKADPLTDWYMAARAKYCIVDGKCVPKDEVRVEVLRGRVFQVLSNCDVVLIECEGSRDVAFMPPLDEMRYFAEGDKVDLCARRTGTFEYDSLLLHRVIAAYVAHPELTMDEFLAFAKAGRFADIKPESFCQDPPKKTEAQLARERILSRQPGTQLQKSRSDTTRFRQLSPSTATYSHE